MNKTLTSWLSVVVVFLCLPLFAFTSGSGTYEDPYEIAGASDIVNLIDMVQTNDCNGVYFLQTADIDLSPFSQGGQSFPGIGGIKQDLSETNYFSGNFDGDGYWISNMFCSFQVEQSYVNECHVGLFGAVKDAVLVNISVQGYITGSVLTTTGYKRAYVGGLAGTVLDGTIIENCRSAVDMELRRVPMSTSTAQLIVGGLIGEAVVNRNVTWHDLVNTGNITVSRHSGGVRLGGIFGYFKRQGSAGSRTTMVGLYNHGTLRSNAAASSNFLYGGYCPSVAGICNFLNDVYSLTIRDSANYGEIYASIGVYASGCIQTRNGAASSTLTLRNVCNYGDLSFVTGLSNHSGLAGVMEGTIYSLNATGLTNYGNINVTIHMTAVHTAAPFCAGVILGSANYLSGEHVSRLANFGNITVTETVGTYKGTRQIQACGVWGHEAHSGQSSEIMPRQAANYGNISVKTVNTSASDVICVAGVASPYEKADASANRTHDVSASDSANFGDITVEVPEDFNGVSSVGGIVAPIDEWQNRIVLSNCYSISAIKWSGSGLNIGGLCGLADTTVTNNEYVYIRNSYACTKFVGETEGNYVGSLVGHATTITDPLAISNCFAIIDRPDIPSIGFANGPVATANIASIAYSDIYHSPAASQGYLYNYAFEQAGKATNYYYDLILPINKLLFPTITEEVKDLHNWTKANGYKRYIRTITNNQ